jgi:hypothetical protein
MATCLQKGQRFIFRARNNRNALQAGATVVERPEHFPERAGAATISIVLSIRRRSRRGLHRHANWCVTRPWFDA